MMNAVLGNTCLLVLTALTAYLIGSVPFGYLIGKAHGIDIRTCGSGNIGATNVTRAVGKKWGKLCFFLDFFKGAVPVLLISLLTSKKIFGFFPDALPVCLPDPLEILPSVAAFSAVAGHIWPCWLKFKGGKGVSTAAGAILALNPPALAAAGIVWVVVFYSSRYVSLASVLAAFLMPLFVFLFSRLQIFRASRPEVVLFCLLALLTVVKHSSNIRRLFNGTENRFVRKGGQPKERS